LRAGIRWSKKTQTFVFPERRNACKEKEIRGVPLGVKRNKAGRDNRGNGPPLGVDFITDKRGEI